MNDDHSHSSLLVPPSTQDWMQGVLSAKVVLVMYGDYQCSRSADVYKMIKAIDRELSASLGEDYLCFIFRHFPQAQIHPHAQRSSLADCTPSTGRMPIKSILHSWTFLKRESNWHELTWIYGSVIEPLSRFGSHGCQND